MHQVTSVLATDESQWVFREGLSGSGFAIEQLVSQHHDRHDGGTLGRSGCVECNVGAMKDNQLQCSMAVLLCSIRTIRNADERREMLGELSRPSKPKILSFFNQHAFNLAWSDEKLRSALTRSDVLLRDGVGIEICLKRLGITSGLNSNGTDLIPLLLETMSPRAIAVFGTRDPWLSRATERIRAMGHRVAVSSDGFGPDRGYVDLCRQLRPEIILLGMGMPRQELLATQLNAELDYPCLIINGGAVLDFLANRHPRAPEWMRRARLEWLFRLRQEPKRLAGRYLLGGVHFAFRVEQLVRDGARAEGPVNLHPPQSP